MNFTVFADDNFHYGDANERYKVGEFDSPEQAIAACKQIVDSFLLGEYKPGMTADQLCGAYMGFGEDPFIISSAAPLSFSAWDYAKERCTEICANEAR